MNIDEKIIKDIDPFNEENWNEEDYGALFKYIVLFGKDLIIEKSNNNNDEQLDDYAFSFLSFSDRKKLIDTFNNKLVNHYQSLRNKLASEYNKVKLTKRLFSIGVLVYNGYSKIKLSPFKRYSITIDMKNKQGYYNICKITDEFSEEYRNKYGMKLIGDHKYVINFNFFNYKRYYSEFIKKFNNDYANYKYKNQTDYIRKYSGGEIKAYIKN